LVATDPTGPEAWFRTPGLLRLATALLHEHRSADATALLTGGARRRIQDGLPAISRVTGFGLRHVVEDGAVRITGLEANSPASRSHLLPGDVIAKVNGDEVTKETISNFEKMLEGDVGTKLRLTVRHPGRTQTEDVDLVKATYRVDDGTGEWFFPLLAALEERQAENPGDAGLHQLRAELAGEEADFATQAASYSAAIKILAKQPAEAVSAHLRRLYRRRGEAYVSLGKWPEAVADYDHVITRETTDLDLLSNRARAHEALKNWGSAAADWSRAATGNREGGKWLAEFARRLADRGESRFAASARTQARAWFEEKLAKEPENSALAAELAELLLEVSAVEWTALKPIEMKSEGGTELTLQPDRSIFVDGRRQARDVYALDFQGVADFRAIRLEALCDDRLPEGGPGTHPSGNFVLSEFKAFLAEETPSPAMKPMAFR
jgi:tetratricopeptide (TPR) repeat protein